MEQELQDSIDGLIALAEEGGITTEQFEQIIRDEITMSMRLRMDKVIWEGEFPLIF